ncbi:Bifunctional chorismate mutase/prephenate dehydratase [Dyadobacter sp. CECT 9275]|uniref:Bifunctional chorismate mutase/prephenate dehydratase n=1 Tax=Dyadobacter helix TaxID=2822344 RepID=A0A916JDE4_9BACT|nr:prephenate dehydratase [Dyadobacter sp. CECT 9275]CAG5004388.1 Bifunctional chorismate mutase/prephenate dehydratase [Dyadobacter sp. CECT 9275]
MKLEDLRNRIDALDDQLLDILNERMELVHQVGELKRSSNSIIYRPEREKQILERLEKKNSGLLTRQAIDAIFFEIFAVSRNMELPERVSFLGPEGSFTHQAAEGRFGAMSEYLVLPTIHSVFESVETGRAKFGVVPIENNQEGIVVETVDFLREKNLTIVAELLLPVHFAFASQADSLKHIKRIYSKDIAFRQCGKFLSEYLDGLGVEIIPVDSTSKAAKLASEEPDSAAVCSSISARLFGVPILFENIEDSDQNKTRFLILAKDILNAKSNADKTTIIANLPNTNRPGVLYEFLKEFNDRGINLTKIESRPLRGESAFRTWFLVEFLGHIEDEPVKEIMHIYGSHLKWLGSYVRVS